MKYAAIVTLLLVFAALPLAAQDRNVYVTIFASQVDIDEDDLTEGFRLELDDARALGASANLLYGSHVSIEAAVFGVRADAGLTFEDVAALDLGSLDLTPITLGAQFHVLGRSRFDPYLGGGGAYILADDLSSVDLDAAGIGRLELDSGLSYYLNAGIGFQITSGLGVVVDARYIPFKTDSRSAVTGVEQELELSPRIVSAGLRFRF
jgi:outer membrane protein W